MNIRINELVDSRDTVNKWMERFGVRFGVYKHGIFNEQLFPFDSIPRIISSDDWVYLEKGLRQRVTALNKFLWDVYHDKRIIKDGIVPEEFVYSSKGYMPECEGISPTGEVYAHIAGIDLVEGKDGQWYVLEDNLRIPSGASYPMIAREITRKVSPQTFTQNAVAENRDYARAAITQPILSTVISLRRLGPRWPIPATCLWRIIRYTMRVSTRRRPEWAASTVV